jgi:hypothetical protein
MAGSETIKLSRTIAGKGQVAEIPQPTFRRGKVVNVSPLKVTIGDDPTPVVPAKAPTGLKMDDVVDLRVTDTEVAVEGANDPFAGVQFASVVTAEPGTNGSAYVDCATVGPAVTVTIGPSGRAKVTISANQSESDSNDGGRMGVAVSGANTIAADDSKSLAFFPKVTGAYSCYSRVLFYTGLNPGSTTFTAKYKDSGGDNTWSQREILVEPM